MKYCTKCGTQLDDDAMFCSACGAATGASAPGSVNTPPVNTPSAQPAEESGIKTIAKVFMLINCILTGLWLIPLAWMVPMTVTYWNKVKDHQPVGTGFKVCTLLFVSLIAGILMLCDDTPD